MQNYIICIGMIRDSYHKQQFTKHIILLHHEPVYYECDLPQSSFHTCYKLLGNPDMNQRKDIDQPFNIGLQTYL